MNLREKIKYEYNKGNSAIRQIIAINLAVFVFTILVGVVAKVSGYTADDLLQYFYLPSNLGTLLIRPWTIVTNIFFHGGFWHILGNLLLLYFLGGILEDFLSPKHIWKIFLYGGLAGGFLFIFSYNIFPIFKELSTYQKLLGASGGVTAIIVATGIHLPHYNIRPFGLFNVEMRWVALFFVFRDLYMFPASDNTGGLFAHMGGAIFGALYIMHLQGKIDLPKVTFNPKVPTKMKKVKVDEKEINYKHKTRSTKPNQEEIDAILDKISHSGYDSLSKEEKDILFKASE